MGIQGSPWHRTPTKDGEARLINWLGESIKDDHDEEPEALSMKATAVTSQQRAYIRLSWVPKLDESNTRYDSL